MPALEIIAVVAGSLVAVLAVWAMLLPIVAWFSGWRLLAEQFAAAPGTRGRLVLGNAAMRYGAHYSGIILLDCLPAGLVLSVRKPFRLAHPPLLIPWSQVEAEPTKLLWILPATRLDLGRDAHVPLIFYSSEAREWVDPYLGASGEPHTTSLA
ncbi:MAG TPA: hypothetical protein VME68_00365 [Acidobacteriaceae bacterium]|nr:hypothetical protein [Acidobacteriaceae bacterium]